MNMQITILPEWRNGAVPFTDTTVIVEVDVSSIYCCLKHYDLYLAITLSVASATVPNETLEYSNTKIYRNITTTTIEIPLHVIGPINDSAILTSNVTAYFIQKRKEDLI